ncbi:MAG: glycosyltransferase family 39 protein, partial [Prevotella sp.]|nr:glycosyltransferase family 39 protein [Prevotella sp.]
MERIISILKKNIYMVYGLLLLLTILFIVLNNKYTFFWFDEGFSISLVKHSYKDIWNLTAQDVHPPLYYYMLKIYSSLVGDSILSLRFFSAIPVFLTALIACFKVRRFWGGKVAVLFIALMLATPITYYLTSEIRMYSWTMFFVFMAFLYAYQSYAAQQKYPFVLFAVFSLLAAYTHYYSLIAVAYIYALLFLLLLAKDKKKIPLLFASAVLCIIAYAPWMINLINQVKAVTKDYWITSAWLDDIMEFLYPVYILKE